MKITTKKKTHTIEITKGADKAVFEVMPMDVSENNKLLKKYTSIDKVKGILYPETDYFGFALAKVKKVIISWEHLEDENGTPILECNDQTKEQAYILNPDLINEVLEKADKIAAGRAGVEEEEIKN